jgi:hypothetical protein
MAKKRPTRKRVASNAPGRGRTIPNELIAKFRVEYLRSGSLSAAAHAVKLPPSSCQRLADAAEEDPTFVSARKLFLSRGLDRVEAMLIRAAELASERLEEGPVTDALGSIVDNGPQYFRGLSDAHRALAARRAKEMPDDPSKTGPVEVRITVAGESPTIESVRAEPAPDVTSS